MFCGDTRASIEGGLVTMEPTPTTAAKVKLEARGLGRKSGIRSLPRTAYRRWEGGGGRREVGRCPLMVNHAFWMFAACAHYRLFFFTFRIVPKPLSPRIQA